VIGYITSQKTIEQNLHALSEHNPQHVQWKYLTALSLYILSFSQSCSLASILERATGLQKTTISPSGIKEYRRINYRRKIRKVDFVEWRRRVAQVGPTHPPTRRAGDGQTCRILKPVMVYF